MGMPEPRPEAGRKSATTTVAGAETLDAATVQAVVKETKDLIRSLEGTGTRRVRIKAGRLEIEVERRLRAASPAAGAQPAAPGSSGAAAAPAATPGRMPVVSPLVGVFYRSGSPG